MKLLRLIGAAVVGVTVLATQALAADATAVRTMMEKSGLVAQYQDLGSQMRDGMLKSPPPMLPSGVASLLATIIGKTMNGNKLLDRVQTVLAASLSDKDVKAMGAFFDSALGARIVKAEIAGAAPAVQDEIGANAAKLLAELRKDPQRLAVFERIDKMLHTTDLSVRSSQSLLRAMAVAMAESGPMAPDPNKLAQADAQIDAMRGTLQKQIHTMILATAERVYRGFSTAEMKTYADFLATDPSRIMYAAFAGVMDGFYVETGKRIGEELAAALRQQKT
jgi:hypothetical protein